MDENPIYRYFCENVETVSKKELLEALRSALESSHYWREAYLLGLPAGRTKNGVGAECLSDKKEHTA
ncbi:MAG: hypothetical protein ABFD97_04295 [Syntrophobacter sp.]